MDFETLLFEKAEGVATVTLNRPGRQNAFNQKMADELRDCWNGISKDPEVVCTILTAAGDRAFCTGMDVADVASGDSRASGDLERDEAPWMHLTAVQNHCWKPVITAVNGMCNGGGLHFIADSDLILASETASFFDTHVKVGLVAGLEPVGLVRRIPLEAVLRMALLGGSERMDAKRAYEIGLVGEVVPAADLMPRARALASKIAKHSPAALARTKRTIWQSLDVGLNDALTLAWEAVREHNSHPDISEGTRAFMEKRKPRWAPWTE